MNTVLKGWNWIRWIRLGLGILIIYNGLIVMDWLLLILGGVLAAMALTNSGCAACATGACKVVPQSKVRDDVSSTH